MKRILFVDDDTQVLDALRALLRRQRSLWEMVFVDSGEKALDELAGSTFDVIVSDMRMPGMDGAQLLTEVQRRHPAVVRIVLSGYAEMEAALRTVPVAHQFLAKPCDAGLLENVVGRACALQALVSDDSVRRVVGKLKSLPALPRIYHELTRTLADENAGVAEVARVVERDPTMVAKVLQLVNSAFLGLGRPVTSIDQAVAFIGTSMLRDLSLVAQVFSPGELAPAGKELDAIQHHAMLVGTTARRLAGSDRKLSEDAFIAGILHDIGKLILAAEQPAKFTRLLARAREERKPLFEVEREELGVSHAELGGYLLGLWGLPYAVIEPAANHHAPQRVAPRPGLDVFGAVYVANVLVHEQVEALGQAGEAFEPLDEAYLAAMELADRLEEWREIAADVVRETPAADSSRRAA